MDLCKSLLLVFLSSWVAAGCAHGSATSAPASPSAGAAAADTAPSSEAETAQAAGSKPEEEEVGDDSEGPRTIEELCATAPCRKNVTVDLLASDGSRFKKSYPLMAPAVQGRLITVLAGETVLVEATDGGERPSDFVYVEKVRHPERTIRFKLEQHEKDGKAFMMLTTKNPFSRDLRMHLSVMLLSNGQIAQTSSCPVRAGFQASESWPDALFQILVEEVRFMKEGESQACVK